VQIGKTIVLLKTLTKKEFKELGRFVNSPVHNRNKNLIKLYSFLKKYYPEFLFSRKEAFNYLFPDKNHNDTKIRQLMNSLLHVTYEYFAYSYYSDKEIIKKINLINKLSEKNADKLVNEQYKIANILLKSSKIKDADYFYKNYLLETTYMSYLGTKSNLYEKLVNSFKTQHENFNKYVLNMLLRLNLERLAFEPYTRDSRLLMLDELLMHLKKVNYVDPQINLFYKLILMKIHPEIETYYHEFKETLHKNLNMIEFGDKVNMFISLTNYCVEKFKRGNEKFVSEAFEIYKEVLKRKLYEVYEGNHIHHLVYISVVRVALTLKEFGWAVNFILKYRNKLPPSHRMSAFHYCLACYYYEHGKLDEALVNLSKVDAIDLQYKLRVKLLILKIYYDLNEDRLISAHYDSLRHFIKRNF
jgi:hypothetical protein